MQKELHCTPMGFIREGSTPLLASAQTENHFYGNGGGTPNCFFHPCRQGKTHPANAGGTTSCRGFEPRPVRVAQLVEPIPCCRTRITPWRMLVGTTFLMSRSWVRVPLLQPCGRIAQLVEHVVFHPFLVARDQNSGISSGWLECRTWTAEVGGSNPPSLTKRNMQEECLWDDIG